MHPTTLPQLIVIGGGLAGISAAIKNIDNYKKVIVIEKSRSLGGLLNGLSISNHEYPIGAHFLRKSGITRVDEIIFSDCFEWTRLEYLRSGSISFGRLDTNNGFLNINCAPMPLRIKPYLSILSRGILGAIGEHESNSARNQKDYLCQRFGPEIVKVFDSLSLKYFGVDTESLEAGSLDPLCCTDRVKVLSPRITRLLKHMASYDSRIAYHNSHEGSVPYQSFLPYKLKYREWWSRVAQRLTSIGIEIMYNTRVQDFKDETLLLSRGDHNCTYEMKIRGERDLLIDTTGALGKPNTPRCCSTVILFFESDSKPVVNNHFITSYNPDDSFSRVTLCSNIGADHNGLVVECVMPSFMPTSVNQLQLDVVRQLKSYRLFLPEAVLTFVKHLDLGFSGFRPKIAKNNQRTPSTGVKGIAGQDAWFMNEVIHAS